MRMCHFWAQNGPFARAPLNLFFGKLYYSHLPISRFHCAKF